jgi:hypothetical protein
MANAQERLNELATLEDGWLDGDGKAVGHEPMSLARELVDALSQRPNIYPTPEGGLQLVYRHGDSYVEFELRDDGNHETWIGLDE